MVKHSDHTSHHMAYAFKAYMTTSQSSQNLRLHALKTRLIPTKLSELIFFSKILL